ncbi:hypothetical protein BEP19_08865 [Ammoniphilus oxalaticus]|uniref:Putative Flp pilus-assembly TadG-like N-terminal domain-containing protein n=2 Tax=Ammoniphilus oxalaticus TaxID=66863 RepID=A0A419SKM4_9BACL|nr:hypothetical protein BEP19_08865 [Ammoniphilus oxalaticus]
MKRLRQEKGSVMLFTLALLGVMTLLFAVMLNLVKMYTEKQHASNAAEQASLAVTAEIYRIVKEGIDEADSLGLLCSADLLPWPKSMNEQIQEKKNQIAGISSNAEWSEQELYRAAVNEVLPSKLQDPNYICLKEIIERKLWDERSQVKYAAEKLIEAAGAKWTETEIALDKYRVEVKTAREYRAFKYDGWVPENKRNIYQVGKGPHMEFFKYVTWPL